jgi:1-deoxy-D-xylulose-5-phosphate synthase
MARADTRLIGITPAMREGSGLVRFEQEFPDRYFDVGIAEQHAVTFAAGLACEGFKPVVAIYSTFLQRGYDQLIHDVAIQNLDVTFALDRGGLVGNDGATHHGAFDLSYLRCIPNLVVMAPSDENECRRMLTTAFQHAGPAAVRYPRGAGTGAVIDADLEPLSIGKAELRRATGARAGGRIAILAFGSMVPPALAAGEAFDATVVNMRFVKPLDRELLREIAATHDAIVTVEENAVLGGAGSACLEALAELALERPALLLGLPDQFVDHGDQARLLASVGLDAAGIERSIRVRFGELLASSRALKSVA